MADLFWAYWDATVRFAVFAAILIVLTPLLKRVVPARWLCWAWAIALFRLAIPLSIPVGGSFFNIHQGLQPSAWTEAIRRSLVDLGFGETILPRLRGEEGLVLATMIPISWETALIALWLAGMLFMAGRLAWDIRCLRRFFDRGERQQEGRLHSLLKDTRRRYGIHANVPLLVSEDLKSPGIAGVFNPRIALPRRMADGLSDDELRCVFMHELTHYRRGDLFAHHALLLLCYLHWYNPLAWLALRQFKESMEQACDETVIDSVCIRTAKEYGYTILRVIDHSRAAGPSAVGALCLLGNRKSSALKERIRLIAQPRKHRPAAATCGLMLFGASFACSLTGEDDPREEAERLLRLTRLVAPFSLEQSREELAEIRLETDVANVWRSQSAEMAVSAPGPAEDASRRGLGFQQMVFDPRGQVPTRARDPSDDESR